MGQSLSWIPTMARLQGQAEEADQKLNMIKMGKKVKVKRAKIYSREDALKQKVETGQGLTNEEYAYLRNIQDKQTSWWDKPIGKDIPVVSGLWAGQTPNEVLNKPETQLWSMGANFAGPGVGLAQKAPAALRLAESAGNVGYGAGQVGSTFAERKNLEPWQQATGYVFGGLGLLGLGQAKGAARDIVRSPQAREFGAGLKAGVKLPAMGLVGALSEGSGRANPFEKLSEDNILKLWKEKQDKIKVDKLLGRINKKEALLQINKLEKQVYEAIELNNIPDIKSRGFGEEIKSVKHINKWHKHLLDDIMQNKKDEDIVALTPEDMYFNKESPFREQNYGRKYDSLVEGTSFRVRNKINPPNWERDNLISEPFGLGSRKVRYNQPQKEIPSVATGWKELKYPGASVDQVGDLADVLKREGKIDVAQDAQGRYWTRGKTPNQANLPEKQAMPSGGAARPLPVENKQTTPIDVQTPKTEYNQDLLSKIKKASTSAPKVSGENVTVLPTQGPKEVKKFVPENLEPTDKERIMSALAQTGKTPDELAGQIWDSTYLSVADKEAIIDGIPILKKNPDIKASAKWNELPMTARNLLSQRHMGNINPTVAKVKEVVDTNLLRSNEEARQAEMAWRIKRNQRKAAKITRKSPGLRALNKAEEPVPEMPGGYAEEVSPPEFQFDPAKLANLKKAMGRQEAPKVTAESVANKFIKHEQMTLEEQQFYANNRDAIENILKAKVGQGKPPTPPKKPVAKASPPPEPKKTPEEGALARLAKTIKAQEKQVPERQAAASEAGASNAKKFGDTYLSGASAEEASRGFQKAKMPSPASYLKPEDVTWLNDKARAWLKDARAKLVKGADWTVKQATDWLEGRDFTPRARASATRVWGKTVMDHVEAKTGQVADTTQTAPKQGVTPSTRVNVNDTLSPKLDKGSQGDMLQELKGSVMAKGLTKDEVKKVLGDVEGSQVQKHMDSLGLKVLDWAGILRVLQAGGDFSAIGRQGLFATLGHPEMAKKGIGLMWKSFLSEKDAIEIDNMLRHSNDTRFGKGLGTYAAKFIDHGGVLPAIKETAITLAAKGRQEEMFGSTAARHLPMVRPFERAYIAYLNYMRLNVFKKGFDDLEKLGLANKKELDQLGSMVNVVTGRSDLGGERANALFGALNQIFYAPRYTMSGLQMLGKVFRPGTSPYVRKQLLRYYGIYLGIGSSLLGLAAAAGAKIELDPRDTNFLKVQVGDTKIDFWRGYAQWARLAARLSSGQTKTGGKVSDTDYSNEAARFLQSKLAPPPSLAWDTIRGADFQGNPMPLSRKGGNWKFDPIQLINQGTQRMVPITAQDLYTSVWEDAPIDWETRSPNWLPQLGASSFNVLGFGATTYPNEKAKPYQTKGGMGNVNNGSSSPRASPRGSTPSPRTGNIKIKRAK